MNTPDPQKTAALAPLPRYAPSLEGFQWHERNRTVGFDTWADEIAHVGAQGYILVPPDYHIPHWSRSKEAPQLYVNGRHGPQAMNQAFDRPARDMGYPLFFLHNGRDDPRP
jgi:hypothetical protein